MDKRSYIFKLNVPLRIFLIVNMLALLLLPPGTNRAIAATPTAVATVQIDTTDHTIVIDGDLTDWSVNEWMEIDGAATLYTTWDANNLYFGLSGVYLGEDPAQDKSFFICFDTDQLAGLGASSDGYGSVNFNTALFAPEFCFYFAGESGLHEWSTWNGSNWNWNSWRSEGAFYNWPDNPAPFPGSELTIARLDIGNPTSLRMAAWLTQEDAVPPKDLEATWPSQNAIGTTPIFSHFYHFPSLVKGITPKTSVLADSIIINEFRPKSTEFIELYNPTDQSTNLSGWYLDDDPCGIGTSLIGTVDLAPGAYFVVNAGEAGDNFDLSNDGDFAYLCNATHTEVDSVAYGYSGGAPLSHTSSLPGNSTARTPNGTDTDNDAADWNVATTPTQGNPNNAPAVLLGSALVFNEFDNYPASGNDKVEIYNPTAQAVSLNGWSLSDGDGIATIVTSPVVDPGGWVVLEETIDWTFAMDFSNIDVGYLFLPNGIRVDQLGWYSEFEDFTFQRISDGEGPNDGYNWTSSGGGLTLYDIPPTLGFSNQSPASLEITKSAPTTSYPGSLLVYNLSVTNNGIGTDATGVVVTDTIPSGTIYATGGNDYANGVVTFTLPAEIAWGTTVEYTFGVTVTASYGSEIVNDHYGVDSNETVPVSGTPVTTTIAAFDVSIDKQAPLAISQDSQSLTYAIDVVNTGVISVANVIVTDTLPVGTSYLGDNSGFSPNNPSPGVYLWALDDILADTTFSFNLTVTLDITTPRDNPD